MIERLKTAMDRYDQITAALANPSVATDMEKFRTLSREQKQLTPLYDACVSYFSLQKQLGEAMLLAEDTDVELAAMAQEEYQNCKKQSEELLEEIKILMLPKDAHDAQNVIMEIRAGAGGEEAALFASVLYRMYTMYAQSEGFRCEIVSCNETELGGIKEIQFMIIGEGAYSRLKFESGVHRVQRVPETESSGRIHTSTVTVAVLPEVEEVDVVINPADIRIETIKSTGAGGQHVNKTESAVRLYHKPSGIVIECREERSQFQNRDKAMRLLRTKLYDQMQSEQQDRIAGERRSQIGTGDRSERIRTYNYPQGRITDHRIGLTLYTLDTVLNGNIGVLIQALITADTAERLKQGEYDN